MPKRALAAAVFLMTLLTASPHCGEPAAASPRKALAIRASGPITIDGALDEAAWKAAPAHTGFTQDYPNPGEPPSCRTLVRFLYDDKILYVGITCLDPDPASIDRRLSRRDRWVSTDAVNVSIDSRMSGREAYNFEIMASGTRLDAAIYNEFDWNYEWDGFWEGQTSVTGEGWEAEMAVPFSELRFGDRSDLRFGVQVGRHIHRFEEGSSWVYIPPEIHKAVSGYGTLNGIEGIAPGTGIEFVPFAVARTRLHARRDFYPLGLDFDAGLDFKFPMGTAFTLTGTVNPDFGQVEQDEVVLNLSTYETFFPEKRPFFLEGFQIFTPPTIGPHGMRLLHTRRIGAPPWEPAPPEGGAVVAAPETTTILGAGKVTGTTSGGLTFGGFAALTQEEKALVIDGRGEKSEILTSHETLYGAARMEQRLGSNSSIGLFSTRTDRRSERDATIGALTWDLHFADNRDILQGNLVRSWIRNGGDDPDGFAAEASYQRRFGELWLSRIMVVYHDRDIDPNDMGYLRRNDNWRNNLWIQRRQFEPGEVFFRTILTFNLWYAENLAGKILTRGGNVSFNGSLKNHCSIWGGASLELPWYDDRETRAEGVLYYRRSAMPWFWIGFNSDDRKPLVLDLNIEAGRHLHGLGWRAYFGVVSKPTDRTRFSAGLNHAHDRGDFRWASTLDVANGTHILFADLESRRWNLELRASYIFTPDLTIDLYAQFFDASGHYTRFRKLHTATTFTPYGGDINPDFRLGAFNLNLVGRWEFRPGSTLYAVYSHGQQGYESGGPGRDGPAMSPRRDLTFITSAPRDDLVLLKVSYRF